MALRHVANQCRHSVMQKTMFDQGLAVLSALLDESPELRFRSDIRFAHPATDCRRVDANTVEMASHGLLGIHSPLPQVYQEWAARESVYEKNHAVQSWFDLLSRPEILNAVRAWRLQRNVMPGRVPVTLFQSRPTTTQELVFAIRQATGFHVSVRPLQASAIDIKRTASHGLGGAGCRLGGGMSLGDHTPTRLERVVIDFGTLVPAQLIELKTTNSELRAALDASVKNLLPASVQMIFKAQIQFCQTARARLSHSRLGLTVLTTHSSTTHTVQWN